MTVEIRTAKRGDWEAIERLLSEAGLPVQDLSETASEQFTVYVDASRVQGVVALETLAAGQGLLRSLAVAPGLQKSGVGNQLVRYLEATARDRGIAELYLLTTTASGYFARFGYLPVARDLVPASVKAHEQFRSLCPSSAVVMCKRIAAEDG